MEWGPEVGGETGIRVSVIPMTEKEARDVRKMMFEHSAFGLQTCLGFDDERLIGMSYVVLRESLSPANYDRIIIGNNAGDVRRNIETYMTKQGYIMKSKIYKVEEPCEWT